MNNIEIESLIQDCRQELLKIQTLIKNLGVTSAIVPYLSKYSLVKACGTIEIAYKQIITDKCSFRCNKQTKRFLEKKVNRSSANPSYGKMCELVKDFDEQWCLAFKSRVKDHPSPSLHSSLKSLVDARNEFAHGGNPHVSIDSIISYFDDAIIVVTELDAVIG